MTGGVIYLDGKGGRGGGLGDCRNYNFGLDILVHVL